MSVPSMTSQRMCCAAKSHFVYGGHDGRDYLSSVEAYDIRSWTWLSVPSMTTKREGFAAVVIRNEIFVCGGTNGRHYHSSVEAFGDHS